MQLKLRDDTKYLRVHGKAICSTLQLFPYVDDQVIVGLIHADH